jgi:hypothetical protein
MVVALGWFLALPPGNALAAYQGWIVDAETHEPVEGVVVFIEFLQPNALLGEGRHYVNAAEVLTDTHGYFSVPYKGWSWLPWRMLVTSNLVTIFKSGYAPLGGTWANFLDVNWGVGSSMGQPIWKMNQGKPYILLQKANPDIKKRLSDLGNASTSGVPPEKKTLLDNEVEKEYKLLVPCKKEGTC